MTPRYALRRRMIPWLCRIDDGERFTAHDIADRFGVHWKNAWKTLRALADDGLIVDTDTEHGPKGGRPRVVFKSAICFRGQR